MNNKRWKVKSNVFGHQLKFPSHGCRLGSCAYYVTGITPLCSCVQGRRFQLGNGALTIICFVIIIIFSCQFFFPYIYFLTLNLGRCSVLWIKGLSVRFNNKHLGGNLRLSGFHVKTCSFSTVARDGWGSRFVVSQGPDEPQSYIFGHWGQIPQPSAFSLRPWTQSQNKKPI